MSDPGARVEHRGGCHCGRVRWIARAPADIDVLRCNCSMCNRLAYLHLIVDAGDFTLESGADDLTEYTFGTGAAKHRFCRVCGIKSFYVPRSHPDGYSVNARCIDEGTIASMNVEPFDGRNWEDAKARLE